MIISACQERLKSNKNLVLNQEYKLMFLGTQIVYQAYLLASAAHSKTRVPVVFLAVSKPFPYTAVVRSRSDCTTEVSLCGLAKIELYPRRCSVFSLLPRSDFLWGPTCSIWITVHDRIRCSPLVIKIKYSGMGQSVNRHIVRVPTHWRRLLPPSSR
jgi:hypothetical protein